MQPANIEQIKKIKDIHNRNENYIADLYESQEIYNAHHALHQYCHEHRGILLDTIFQFWSKFETIELAPLVERMKQWSELPASPWEKETLPAIVTFLEELQAHKQPALHHVPS